MTFKVSQIAMLKNRSHYFYKKAVICQLTNYNKQGNIIYQYIYVDKTQFYLNPCLIGAHKIACNFTYLPPSGQTCITYLHNVKMKYNESPLISLFIPKIIQNINSMLWPCPFMLHIIPIRQLKETLAQFTRLLRI